MLSYDRVDPYLGSRKAPRLDPLEAIFPPLPDLYVKRDASVYSVEPLTETGRSFLAQYIDGEYGQPVTVDGPAIFYLLDEAFDSGVKVV